MTNTTASIDLAQLDREFKRFHQMLCERFDYTHDERDWKRDQLSLIEHIARRSLTSGAPAEPVAEVTGWERQGGGYSNRIHWRDTDQLPVGTKLYAAPVHDAAAPSDVQRCKDCGRTGWHVCRYSAGAAAKTEQAEGAVINYGTMTQQGAAGAGSAQPRAEGDERETLDQRLSVIREFGDEKLIEAVATGQISIHKALEKVDGNLDALAQTTQAATTASASDASLREAVRAITLLIQNREWADVLNMDADAAALWEAVDDMISDRAALARAPLPAQTALTKLECPACGTDRLKKPCPRMADECAMGADAHMRANDGAAEGGSQK